MSDRDRYDGKYGEKTVSWNNRDSEGNTKQYNVKDVESGDHYFVNTQTGVMGAALGDFRPHRDNHDK